MMAQSGLGKDNAGLRPGALNMARLWPLLHLNGRNLRHVMMRGQGGKHIAHHAAQFSPSNIANHGEMQIIARQHGLIMGANIARF